jgi:glucose/arabinose dehydrogenase
MPRRTVPLLALCASLLSSCGDDGSSLPESAGSTVATQPPTVELDAAIVELDEVAELDQPVAMAAHPTTDVLYVAERPGRVRTMRPGDGGYDVDDDPALDLTDRINAGSQEQGLLGLAFSSDGRELYVDYTDTNGDTRVVGFPVDGEAVADEPRVLLEIAQPAANHNGGQLAVGPDGFLYVGMGDGGSQADPDGNGQNTEALLGKVLRIDPASGGDERPYGIPEDNPFAEGGGAPEVWLYGVRNPWRFSFDRATGDLWIADVGGSQVEEIDLLPAEDGWGGGANLGWDRLEGNLTHEGDEPAEHVLPIHTYGRDLGCSITGGFVYRGEAIPELQGVYVYGDFCQAQLRGLVAPQQGADGAVPQQEGPLGPEVSSLSSFGEDRDGELFVLSLDGTIWKIVPGSGG